MTADPRQPQVFDLDDPALVREPDPVPETPLASAPVAAEEARPTLADLSATGWRWGLVFLSSLAGALALGFVTWFADAIASAMARGDWLGKAALAFLGVAALAALIIALRELIGFIRLASLKRLKQDATEALATRDGPAEKSAALRLVGLYDHRRELARGVKLFRDHTRDVHDPGDLLALLEREVLAQLDTEARSLVTRSAKRVATVTALSPMMAIAVVYVLIENLHLLRALATLYGARPGLVGALRLARMVFVHIVATGGLAMTDDLLGQFLGQDLLRRLSRRLGEGAFNGALTARIGVTALDVIRPLPFLSSRPPRVRDILAEALKHLVPARSKGT
jgi:putative membrane protein